MNRFRKILVKTTVDDHNCRNYRDVLTTDPYTRKRFPAFLYCFKLVNLDALENSKQYKNAGKRFRVYGACNTRFRIRFVDT